jgi:hypothetical protein
MAQFSSTSANDLPFAGRLSKGGPSRDSQHPRYATCLISYQLLSKTRWAGSNISHGTLIHILDNDSLLDIFSHCRPVILDKSEVDLLQILGGGKWNRERWWYRLVQVCRRWRYLVLDSAFYLRLSLVCARGTPVADMLANSPPLPLIVDHLNEYHDITAEDEKGITLALQHRARVRRIRLMNPIAILEKLIIALDGEFPILEHLIIFQQRYFTPTVENNTDLKFPETFRAPHLRHLLLENFAILIESPLLTTMGNLVTLLLDQIQPSAYFHLNALLQRLSLIPQLEILGITFTTYYPSGDVEKQLLSTPIVTRVALPNLRWLGFRGACAYLEALLPWVTVPLLEKFQVYLFNELTYSIPHLQQFMNKAGKLRVKTATLKFNNGYLNVQTFPHKGELMFALDMELCGGHLDWQVASSAQVIHTLRAVFSVVEDLSLEYYRYSTSSEWNNEAEHTSWRELLMSFGNVKSLRVNCELMEQLSRALQPAEGESPTELLPELHEISYSARGALRSAFASFIDARQKEGRSIAVVHS